MVIHRYYSFDTLIKVSSSSSSSQKWFPLFANYANTALRHSLFLHRCFKKFAAYFLPVVHRAYVSHVGSRVRSLRSKNRDFIIIGIEVFFSRLIMTRCTFLWLVNSSRRRIHWQGSVYHCLPFPTKYGSFDRHRLTNVNFVIVEKLVSTMIKRKKWRRENAVDHAVSKYGILCSSCLNGWDDRFSWVIPMFSIEELWVLPCEKMWYGWLYKLFLKTQSRKYD